MGFGMGTDEGFEMDVGMGLGLERGGEDQGGGPASGAWCVEAGKGKGAGAAVSEETHVEVRMRLNKGDGNRYGRLWN